MKLFFTKRGAQIRRLSASKRILFSLAALVLFLLVMTLVLKFFEQHSVIDTQRPDDLVANRPVAKTLTEIDYQGLPCYFLYSHGMIPRTFTREKPAHVFRMFITGSSFALGSPYVSGENKDLGCGDISRWVQAELSMRFPSLKFEVINAAMGGVNSGRVMYIAQELVQVDADLLLIATGNNEGFVPRTQFNEQLHRWILYRALKKITLPEPEPAARSYYAPQDPDTKKIEERYRDHIEKMVAAAGEHQARLALVTLPINLKYDQADPMIQGQTLPFPRDDPDLQQGHQLWLDGKYREALAVLARSRNQAYAALFMARCLEALRDYGAAREFYKVYVQHNPQNRIRPSYNVFLRESARRHGLILVDLEKALEDQSPHGIPAPSIFFDYCHMRWPGYQQMAHEIVRVLIDSRIIPAAPGEPRPAPTVDEMIKRYHWEILYRTKDWPIL